MLAQFFLLIGYSSSFLIIDDPDFFTEAPPLSKSYSQKNDLDPVILLGGLAGSRIQYKNSTGTSWGTLWLSVIRFINFKELMEELTPEYDAETETYGNIERITTRPHDFGGVEVSFFP